MRALLSAALLFLATAILLFIAPAARGAALLSVGGSYPTKATLVPGRNSCGAVTVQDNLTTVVQTSGATTLSLSHAGNTYAGVIDEAGRFSTTPKTLTSGASRFTLTIAGEFTRAAMHATVRVDVEQPVSPRTCSYVVDWTATKDGAPNTIPGAPELLGELPQPLFPPNNWWNAEVRDAPIDPASAELLAAAGGTLHLEQRYPYAIVPQTQPLVPVTFDGGDTARWPVPEEAKSDPAWIGNGHLLVVDRERRLLFELGGARWNASATRWEAASGATYRLDANDPGLAVLPGLLRSDELAAPIRHALRVTFRSTNGFVFPAIAAVGTTPASLPLGARLRLRASFDPSPFPVEVQRILEAMKTHGLIVADEGEDFAVSATADARWNVTLPSLSAADFEVVRLGWYPRPAVRVRAVRH